jgi:hypothetical protein
VYVKDLLLLTNNEANRMALLYYATVQSFARLHDKDAFVIYEKLKEFFAKKPNENHNPETELKELEHDLKNLQEHTIICPACHTVNLSHHKFCHHCGGEF